MIGNDGSGVPHRRAMHDKGQAQKTQGPATDKDRDMRRPGPVQPEDRPLEQFRRALIIIGDGEDNGSSLTRDMALEMAHKAEAVIYSISTNRSGQRAAGDKILRYFAEQTGGVSFHPFQARDLEQSFADIANELRHQYFIIYSPTNFSMDGSFHKIRIKTNVKNTFVRARSGYYAPLPDEQP